MLRSISGHLYCRTSRLLLAIIHVCMKMTLYFSSCGPKELQPTIGSAESHNKVKLLCLLLHNGFYIHSFAKLMANFLVS